jgi:CBS domain containing-hemolysin-like protein
MGQILDRFKSDIDQPLSAILTLNTIAHTVGAIGVGAQAAKLLSNTKFLGINVAAVLVPTVMTLAILILSEIIPKTLGASYWRALTRFTVRALNIVIFILYPLVWLSQRITGLLRQDTHGSILSKTEFSAMAEVIAEQGVLRREEYSVIKSLLRFEAVRAKDIMTPRTVIIGAEQKKTVEDFYEQNKALRLTRIPIYDGSIDHITGFVIQSDLLSQLIEGRKTVLLQDIMRPIVVVKEDDILPDVFNTLLEHRAHIAVVVGEYGGTSGLLTMEDVVETLLGLEIVDEFDRAEDMQLLARQKWEQRAERMGLLQTGRNAKGDGD